MLIDRIKLLALIESKKKELVDLGYTIDENNSEKYLDGYMRLTWSLIPSRWDLADEAINLWKVLQEKLEYDWMLWDIINQIEWVFRRHQKDILQDPKSIWFNFINEINQIIINEKNDILRFYKIIEIMISWHKYFRKYIIEEKSYSENEKSFKINLSHYMYLIAEGIFHNANFRKSVFDDDSNIRTERIITDYYTWCLIIYHHLSQHII